MKKTGAPHTVGDWATDWATLRLAEPVGLRSSTVANETDRMKKRCVRPAWGIRERDPLAGICIAVTS
jgi:hypothetical protein